MSKRLILTLALGVASAFALTLAAPAYACDKDCGCAKNAAKKSGTNPEAKPDAKPAEKPAEKSAAGEKKAELGAPSTVLVAAGDEKKCECQAGGKGCTCKKGECKCANCGKSHFAADEKKPCDCKKGAKDCSCSKGECKCAKAATFAQAEKKPACECPKKECTCAKGECKCHKKAEKGA